MLPDLFADRLPFPFPRAVLKFVVLPGPWVQANFLNMQNIAVRTVHMEPAMGYKGMWIRHLKHWMVPVWGARGIPVACVQVS